jgi:hypothetical protein
MTVIPQSKADAAMRIATARDEIQVAHAHAGMALGRIQANIDVEKAVERSIEACCAAVAFLRQAQAFLEP